MEIDASTIKTKVIISHENIGKWLRVSFCCQQLYCSRNITQVMTRIEKIVVRAHS